MRKYLYLAYDLACICGALLAALYLRHGFPLIQEGKPEDLYLILLVTFATAAIILPMMHTNESMWRFTSSSELINIMIAVALVALVGNSFLFLTSRLQMMPRSVPPMHWALAVGLMCGTRLFTRQLFGEGRARKPASKNHVIIIGANQTAELYLQFIRLIKHPSIVEGFLDSDKKLTNWMFQKYRVLGTPSKLPQIIEQLNVHGIRIRQVVLAEMFDDLPKPVRKLLQDMERDKLIELVHFSKYIGPQLHRRTASAATDFYHKTSTLAPSVYETPAGFYPYFKRGFDIVLGLLLCVLLSPLMVLTALLVAADVGFPILFWQKRPGLRGKPFRLYKFRTMRHTGRKLNEDRLLHKSGDRKRTSMIGKILRRLRLDELPQLLHIITGSMSFVGPRPLLPDDQPPRGEVRLSVRPGATGWAQIHGGDALSPREKLVLDVWYIHNMSFWLDIRILLSTLFVVLKEDSKHKRTKIAHESS